MERKLKNPGNINKPDADYYINRKLSELRKIIEGTSGEDIKYDAMNDFMVLNYIKNNLHKGE